MRNMFWAWLLKYSPLLITGLISFLFSYLFYWVTNKRSDLIFYVSHTQWIQIPGAQNALIAQGQQAQNQMGTGTLFLLNQGKAPAGEVHVAHVFLPAHSVFPDIPREIITLPGGGTAIRFVVLPPKVLVSISYLLILPVTTVEQIVQYIGSEEGYAKRIPVMLQRIFPKWAYLVAQVLMLIGVWVAVNAIWSLTKLLWRLYYSGG